ncbi:N-acetylmuramoyl-L-alanine amidase [Streptomyces sp. 4N509B]|uniref:N-acetylmuramoyl-L-alanine amidase n=1 Tax=Streptomyces sp. 4N509B TaxID=3457413 RepID=UPI003FD4CD46
MPRPPTRLLRPSRRIVLRSGAALLTSAATAVGSAAEDDGGGDDERSLGRTLTAEGSDTDFPGALWAPSDPHNYTAARRPAEHPVEFVVIHVAQTTFEGTIGVFQNPDSEVSAHYVVASEDGRVAQCLRETDIGWHAGNWDYNTRSVGIEHEGWVEDAAWFTDVMYRRSAELTAHICDVHGIPRTREHVIGHNEVPGATHTDPGPLWDWDRYMELVVSA